MAAETNAAYIVDGEDQGIQGAEKIAVFEQEIGMKIDPFITVMADPISMESMRDGSVKLRFEEILGYEPAEQSTIKSDTNAITFIEGIKVKESVLEIQEPDWAPAKGSVRTFLDVDASKLDNGSIWVGRGAMKTTRVLMQAQIDKKELLFFEADESIRTDKNFRIIDATTAVGSLAELEVIRQSLADYGNIRETNSVWPATTQSGVTFGAWLYYDGFKGDETTEALELHMNRNQIAKYSSINLEAGAGSIPQFLAFEFGQLSHVLGVRVVENKYAHSPLVLLRNKSIKGPALFGPYAGRTTIMAGRVVSNLPETGINGYRYNTVETRAEELITIISLPIA